MTTLEPHLKLAPMRASLIVLLIGCAASPIRGQTHEPLRLVTPEGHTGSVTAAGFSHNGRWVVTASKDRSARLWEVATGREVVLLRGHTKGGGLSAAAFSPDDRWVVTASLDDTARVWDVTNGRVIAVFGGHTAAVNSAAFSPDGHMVVTASNDSTARVWDAATGREVGALRGHRGWVNAAAFSPDGRRVVTAANDSTARVWDVGGVGDGTPRCGPSRARPGDFRCLLTQRAVGHDGKREDRRGVERRDAATGGRVSTAHGFGHLDRFLARRALGGDGQLR